MADSDSLKAPRDPGAAATSDEFIRALASRRLAAGDSYRTLQNRTGIPVSTLNDTLTGRRKPRGPVVRKLVETYAADEAQAGRWFAAWTALIVEEQLPESLFEDAREDSVPSVDEGAGPGSPAGSPAPEPVPGRRSVGCSRAWVLASVGTLLVVLVAGFLWQMDITDDDVSKASTAELGAVPTVAATRITVFNVEETCQSQHVRECALALSRSPWDPTSADNVAALVFHADPLEADCVVGDGRPITDETGVSSHRWYHVRLPDSEVTGWLPAVRTHTTADIPACRTPQPSPSVP